MTVKNFQVFEKFDFEYLKKRLATYFDGLISDTSKVGLALGCKKSCTRSRSDGYAQISLKQRVGNKTLDIHPRPWNVYQFVHGISEELDGSHLCGRGKEGCCNMDHIHFEQRFINLKRKRCGLYASCPICCAHFPVTVCPGHKVEGGMNPMCMQVFVPNVVTLDKSTNT